MRAFHDYVRQFPRVRECLPLRTTTKYIVDRVKTMKEDLMSASIPVEQGDVEESEWVTYMQDFRLKYYN